VAPATAYGACPLTRATTADLVAALDEVKLAYTDVEPDAFTPPREKARAVVPCLSDAIGHHVAAELHRTEGLRGVRRPGSRERLSLAFAAARSLEPSFVVSERRWSPKATRWRVPTTRQNGRSSGFELAPPKTWAPRVRRTRGLRPRPADQPTVVQLFGDDGG
jgi:hypothetical protein